MKKLLFLICMLISFSGCASMDHMAHKDRFDLPFFASCPDGFKMQWKNGNCVSGDCPAECVRRAPKEKNQYYAHVDENGQPVISKTPPPKKEEPKEEPLNDDIVWRDDVIAGGAGAEYNNKPIYIYVYRSKSCSYCDRMNTTLNNPLVIRKLNDDFVNIRYDVDQDNDLDVIKNYKIKALPMHVFLDSNKMEIGRRPGFVKDSEFFDILGKVVTINKEQKSKK